MGKAQETMFTDEGLKLNEKFNRVSTCDVDLWGVQAVKQPEDSFEDGFLAASRCKLLEGATPQKILSADKKWSDYMDSKGMKSGIFRWYAGPGVSMAFLKSMTWSLLIPLIHYPHLVLEQISMLTVEVT